MSGWNGTSPAPDVIQPISGLDNGPGRNGGDDDDNSIGLHWPHGAGRDPWSKYAPYTSYVVATCYLSFLCVVAVIMCIRSRTRLRIFACFITYIGLTIAVVGLLRTKYMIGPSWFWAWNFLGEGFGVVVLALTIVSVGSGFYPMAGSKSKYWQMCMVVVGLYGALSITNFAYYVYHKVIFRPLSGEDVQDIRQAIIAAGIIEPDDLDRQRRWEQRQGWIPSINATLTGVKDWRELAWAEQEMFARPLTTLYLSHQLIMEATCICVVFYLFIPLVRHHRHGPIGRPVDSDMMAVGVWYLSSLMTLALAYAILNGVYVVKSIYIYDQRFQALDLCLRITIGPIFFLPAPAFLLRYYREHFRKFRGSSNSSGRNNASTGRTCGSGNNHFNGSTATKSHPNGSFSLSPNSPRVDSRNGADSVPRRSFDISYTNQQSSHEPVAPSNAYGRLKLFQTRDRGLSVESSRVLSKDFECESRHSQNPSEDRPDSYHQCYSNIEMNQRPLRNSLVMDNNEGSQQVEEVAHEHGADVPQAPKPALTQQPRELLRSKSRGGLVMARADFGVIPNGPLKTFDSAFNQLPETKGDVMHTTEDTTEESATMDPTGTTGWEVGGFSSHEQITTFNTANIGREQSDGTQSAVSDIPYYDTPIEQLTGLQKQLAEHRSALLPQVIAFKAYHEDLATAGPFDHTFKPSSIPTFEPDILVKANNDPDSRLLFPFGPPDEDLVAGGLRSSKSGVYELETELQHSVDAIHWSVSPLPLKKGEDACSGYPGTTSLNKPKDGFVTVFSRALTGSNSAAKSTHIRHNQDSRDRRLRSGDIDISSAELLMNKPVNASVKQLTQLSATRNRDLVGTIEEGISLYSVYSDPYEDEAGFKRPSDSPRHEATNNNISSPQHAYGRSDGSGTATITALVEANGSSTSVVTKGGACSQSLGPSKSRESLPKSSTPTSTSTTGARDIQASRPMSPASKNSSSRLSARSTRSKSDSLYREAAEISHLPSSTDPAGPASRLLSSATMITSPETPVVPAIMLKTSLSPPPRQSWRRSKSFKGTNTAIAAIDTVLANSQSSAVPSDALPSASASNTSLSSSTQSSPTAEAINGYRNDDAGSPITRRPLSPLSVQAPGSREHSVVYREARASKENERILPLSPPLTGLSSRLHSSGQRSVENLSSASYHKSASEQNGTDTCTVAVSVISAIHTSHTPRPPSQPSPRQYRAPSGIAIPSSLYSSSMSPALGSPSSPGSQSLTNYSNHAHKHMLADDPWTQALVNRAQGATPSKDHTDAARPPMARAASD
ncbi:hypothetical protein BGX28_005732 [Mortierella sp. GBA30]|nr:hypothetical protein BGX28_005732 [Mortierella sp. GBA30]